MSDTRRFFRAAGYVFTYTPTTRRATVRIEMWREDPTTRERFWVTVATCAPDRRAAYGAAMALVAWVRALDVSPRASTQAQAVAESLALLNDRLGRLADSSLQTTSPADVALKLALHQLLTRRSAAA